MNATNQRQVRALRDAIHAVAEDDSYATYERALLSEAMAIARNYYDRHTQVSAFFFIIAGAALAFQGEEILLQRPNIVSFMLAALLAWLGFVVFGLQHRYRNIALQSQATARRIVSSWPICDGRLPPPLRRRGNMYLSRWELGDC